MYCHRCTQALCTTSLWVGLSSWRWGVRVSAKLLSPGPGLEDVLGTHNKVSTRVNRPWTRLRRCRSLSPTQPLLIERRIITTAFACQSYFSPVDLLPFLTRQWRRNTSCPRHQGICRYVTGCGGALTWGGRGLEMFIYKLNRITWFLRSFLFRPLLIKVHVQQMCEVSWISCSHSKLVWLRWMLIRGHLMLAECAVMILIVWYHHDVVFLVQRQFIWQIIRYNIAVIIGF